MRKKLCGIVLHSQRIDVGMHAEIGSRAQGVAAEPQKIENRRTLRSQLRTLARQLPLASQRGKQEQGRTIHVRRHMVKIERPL